MKRKMTPEEFHQYWVSEDKTAIIAGEYSEAKSDEEKEAILKKYGLSAYKEEVEREIWLEEWSADRFAEEVKKPIDQITSVEDFITLLDAMKFRDYEKEYLISAHIGGIFSLLAYKPDRIRS
ncbi:MAG: hypothetical protein ACUVWN_10290 [bacterium]